jgi:hypothetical protein
MAAVVINPPTFGRAPETRTAHGCGREARAKFSREQQPAEARQAIKVPLEYHRDKHWMQILKDCSANQVRSAKILPEELLNQGYLGDI